MGLSASPYATELHAAVLSGRILAVRRFIDRGARVTARDKIDRTPLHWAVAVGLEDIAKILLISTPPRSLKAGDKYGRTVLHYAAASGNVSLARVMINRGASVNAEDQRLVTPLHLAAEQVNPEMVQLLLGHGALCGAADAEGRNPRDYAERVGSAHCARLLREAEERTVDRSAAKATAVVAAYDSKENTGGLREGETGALLTSSHANAAAASASPAGSDAPSQLRVPMANLANVPAADTATRGSRMGADPLKAAAREGDLTVVENLNNLQTCGRLPVCGGVAEERRLAAGGISSEASFRDSVPPECAGRLGAGEEGFSRSGFVGVRCGEKPSAGWDEGWATPFSSFVVGFTVKGVQ
ncbi:unnamed protein product [Closterium sp. NIES-65]|nr:unnamed protein product [Closterium sp. NIES-65]CAI5958019.1 unnamed protein product [Closterium sp. NIES-65]